MVSHLGDDADLWNCQIVGAFTIKNNQKSYWSLLFDAFNSNVFCSTRRKPLTAKMIIYIYAMSLWFFIHYFSLSKIFKKYEFNIAQCMQNESKKEKEGKKKATVSNSYYFK